MKTSFPRFAPTAEHREGLLFPVFTPRRRLPAFPGSGDVHIRMTVKYSNYKRYGSTVKMGEAKEIKNP